MDRLPIFLLVFPALALWGVAWGIRTLIRVQREHGTRAAKAVLSGIIALCIAVVWYTTPMVWMGLARDWTIETTRTCMSNTRLLSLATRAYAEDHHGAFRPARDWCDAIRPYLKDDAPYICPAAAGHSRSSYAFNSAVAGMSDRAIEAPERTVAIFESDAGWNAAGGQNLLPTHPRHRGFDTYGFADGHSAGEPRTHASELKWSMNAPGAPK